jgi:hypothetical protein
MKRMLPSMRPNAIDVALKRLAQTGRARIRVLTRDRLATETRLRNRAAWISKPNARLRVATVREGDGFLEVDLFLDGTELPVPPLGDQSSI